MFATAGCHLLIAERWATYSTNVLRYPAVIRSYVKSHFNALHLWRPVPTWVQQPHIS